MPNFPPNPYPNQVVSWQGYQYQWNGEQWVNLASPNPAIVPVYVSVSEPQPPIIPGSFWFDPATTELSVWVQELGGDQWVQATGATPGQPYVYVSVSPPPDPVEGTLWYRPDTFTLSIWVTSGVTPQWEVISSNEPSPANPAAVIVSTSPPVNPVQGLLWYNPLNQQLSAWVITLSGSSWRPLTTPIQASKATVSIATSPPPNPVQGDLWWQPLLQELRVWNIAPTGNAWLLITDNTPQTQIPPVYISINEPVNPKLRYLWFNPQSQELRVWNGEEWDFVSTSATPIPPPVKVSASPPVGAVEGDLWFDPTTGILSVWYTDLDGGQWLATVPYALIEAATLAEQSAADAEESAALAQQYAEQSASYFKETLIDSTQPGIIYVGKAPLGSLESEEVWTIYKSTFSPTGSLVSEETFTDVTWTDRYLLPI